MTVRVEITGDDAEDVRKQMLNLIGGPLITVPGNGISGQTSHLADDSARGSTEEEAQAPADKKPETKKTAPKKTETKKVEEPAEEVVEEKAEEEESEIKYEDLQKAMLRLTKARNLDRSYASGILQHFGVGHGADLKKSQYAEAYQMAMDLIAEAEAE